MRFKKSLFLSLCGVLLHGIIISQFFSTLLIYNSNIELKAKFDSLLTYGYLTVPNVLVLKNLTLVSTAFKGGIFLSFTIGILLISLTLFFYLLSKQISYNFLPKLFIFWGFLVALHNFHFPSLTLSLYLIVFPIAVSAHCSYIPDLFKAGKSDWIVGILIVAGTVSFLFSPNIFSNIRTNFLLTNKPGISISDFYYRYNLQVAEFLKNLSAKQIKSYTISGKSNPDFENRLRAKILNRDYLFVKEGNTDFKIKLKDNQISFWKHKNKIISIGQNDFLNSPYKILDQFSQKTDQLIILRYCILSSLLLGFPVILYLLVLFLLRDLFPVIFEKKFEVKIIILICSLLIGFNYFQSNSQKITDLNFKKNNFTTIKNNLKSSSLAENYEAITLLARIKQKNITPLLKKLLNSASPLIICRTLRVIGIKKEVTLLNEVKKIVKYSDHWYVQWYAYRTLRQLGWKQINF